MVRYRRMQTLISYADVQVPSFLGYGYQDIQSAALLLELQAVATTMEPQTPYSDNLSLDLNSLKTIVFVSRLRLPGYIFAGSIVRATGRSSNNRSADPILKQHPDFYLEAFLLGGTMREEAVNLVSAYVDSISQTQIFFQEINCFQRHLFIGISLYKHLEKLNFNIFRNISRLQLYGICASIVSLCSSHFF